VKRVLVTGASGFCGRYLCRALQASGHSVFGTYHLSHTRPQEKTCSWHPIDISDFKQVAALFQRVKPQWIFHLAAMSIPRRSVQTQQETFASNAAGTIQILEGMRRYAPKARMLFASSTQVYGRSFRQGKPLREHDEIWPENPYAASKAVAEFACLDYVKRFDLDVRIARPINHLGAGQSPQFVFSDWCRQIALIEKGRRKPVLAVGNLEARRDFLHVLDVVKAYLILMKKGKRGAIYNVCQGHVRSLKGYIDFLRGQARKPLRVKVEQKRMRRYDPPVMTGNPSRLRALGWKPVYKPEQALQELLDDWREKV